MKPDFIVRNVHVFQVNNKFTTSVNVNFQLFKANTYTRRRMTVMIYATGTRESPDLTRIKLMLEVTLRYRSPRMLPDLLW